MTLTLDVDDRGAVLSDCGRYRYSLWRTWNGGDAYVNFVALNPSTADETKDDATIRKLRAFAKCWGFGRMCVTNLFALRATDPREMKAHASPVGDENDAWLHRIASGASKVVLCWGTHGTHQGRSDKVLAYLREIVPGKLLHLSTTKGGQPGHPLYLPTYTEPKEWIP